MGCLGPYLLQTKLRVPELGLTWKRVVDLDPIAVLQQLRRPDAAAMAALTVTGSAPQPATRKRKQEVLDEDEWTELLEQIISRDFFPDVPKLENKLEWLQVQA